MSDVARVMGGDFRKVIQISKGLPDEFDDLTLQDHKELMLKARDDGDARREVEQYKEFYSYWADDVPADVNDPDSSPKRIVECAYRLVDKIKAQGTHAGGVIIADCPIDSIVPLSFIKSGKKEGVWTSQWTEGLRSTQLSKFGLIKFDILGLKTMQYIWVACNFVRENRGISIDFDDLDPTIDKAGSLVRDGIRENISFCDELTLKMINDLKTESVFQIETPIQKGIIRDGKVKSFNDLVVFNAMGRPGPIEAIPTFLKNRDDPGKKWKKGMDPRIIKILEDTHGTLCYQEQLCMTWRVIAKFSVPEAEAYRKIIAKKWVDKLIELENRWKSGATEVIGKKAADEYWIIMRTFGRYCFNKCLDGETVLEDVVTGEIIKISDLFRNKKHFNLLSYQNNKYIPDEVVDIHYNGMQPVYEIRFNTGVIQKVTLQHEFLCSDNQMRTVLDIITNSYSVKYVSNGVRNEINYNEEQFERQQNQLLSEHGSNLLDRFGSMQEDSIIYLRKPKQVSSTEKDNCYIESIKYLGVRPTYSPEMKSASHNYITTNKCGQPIHRNSHSVSYSLLTYRCAYLKAHYPAEWWGSVMSFCHPDRLKNYMDKARADGVKFGSLNVNKLSPNFIVNNNSVVPGLKCIKGMGESSAKLLCDKPVKVASLDDFVKVYGKRKAIVERLIKFGAFYEIHFNRRALWQYYMYSYGTGKEVTAFRKAVRDAVIGVKWGEEDIKKEREKLISDYRKLYPKRFKIPPKLEKWEPEVRLGLVDFEKMYPDYTVGEIVEEEKRFLGYRWTQLLSEYVIENKNTKENLLKFGSDDNFIFGSILGILEKYEAKKFVKDGQDNKYYIFHINDGSDICSIAVWDNSFLAIKRRMEEWLSSRKKVELCFPTYEDIVDKFKEGEPVVKEDKSGGKYFGIPLLMPVRYDRSKDRMSIDSNRIVTIPKPRLKFILEDSILW
jgi:DNA polymerase III alpha subunit